MFYIFKPAIKKWQGSILKAEIQGEAQDFAKFDSEWHWWKGIPVPEPLPTITFTVNGDAPLFDNFWTGTLFDLYSDRLVSFFRKFGVNFETFPAKLINRGTGQVLDTPYQIFHLLETYPVIDYERSIIEHIEYTSVIVPEIRKLVITKSNIPKKVRFFRVRGESHLVLIHKKLKEKLDAEKITGCSYEPIDEYSTGIDALWERYYE